MNSSLLQNTLFVGVGATLIAMSLGLGVALTLSAAGRLVRNLLLVLSFMTLSLPPFLLANNWMHYLGEAGVWHCWLPLDLFSLGGAILVLSLWLWPITALAVWGAWQRIESAQLEAEPDLCGLALFRFLLLPMARGALVVAALITLVLAASNLTIPALLQVNVYPAEIWLSFSSTFWVKSDGSFDWMRAASQSWPLLVLPMVVLTVLRRKTFPWPALTGGAAPGLFRQATGPWWLASAGVLTAMVLLLSVGLPLWQVAGKASTWTQLPDVVASGRQAIFNSVGISAAVAVACVGLAASCVMLVCSGRTHRCDGPLGIGLVLWLPFLVPGVLIGIALIQLLNRPATAWFYQSLGVVILALGVRYLVIGWSIVRHALLSVDADLSDAARLDGASRWQLFRHVLWPQVAPQCAAAWCIVFLLCLWDVETLVLIIPPGGETVALRVFNLLHYGHTSHVNALCLVLLGLAVAPLLLVAALVRVRTLLTPRRGVRALTSATTIGIALCSVTGCAPRLAPNEAPVESGIFDRVQIIATRGVAPGQVNKPRSVVVDHDDNLFVLDFTGRVQKFSPEGEFLLFWQMPETKQGNPKGLSVNRDGNIIVVEPHYSRVNLFTPGGKLLMQWGQKGTNGGQFSFPRAAVVNSKREWFVSEFGVVDRVQKFAFESSDPSGLRFLAAFGQAGAKSGEFNRAEGLFVDEQDRVLVADAVNHRIQVFDREGRFLREFGRAGNAAGELSYPYDVCVDSAGRHFVCEFGNSRVQVFDPAGRSIEILGGPAAVPGFFNNPWGVALDSKGNLYVADSRNHRVQKFIRKAIVSRQNSGVILQRGNEPTGAPLEIADPQSAIVKRRS